MTLLHELIDDAARRSADATAVSTTTESLTHGELARASAAAAAWLRGLGVRRGERVVIVAPSEIRVPVLAYAASRLGAPFALLHEQTRGRALAHVLDDAEPVLLVAADADARAAAAERGITAVPLADVPLTDVPLADVPPAAGTTATEAAAPVDAAATPLAVDPVCLIYTSGTTAAPKAVVSTHQQAVFAVHAIQSQLRYRPDDVVYCPLPLSFDYGLYQLFLGAASGAHIRLGLPAEVGPSLLRNVENAGATVLASVPAVAETLARLLRRAPGHRLRLRLLTNTGAAMAPQPLTELRTAVPTLRVQLMFGLTECKRAAINPPDADLDHPGTCGRALPGTEIFAAGPDGDRLPPGEIGELVVRGPNVMSGYWRRPELTALRFPLRDGLFPELRTGDHGWLDEEGYVHFVGRLDDIYKERGFRVSATEVEAAALRVAGVERAAVLPPADGRTAVLVVVGAIAPPQVLVAMRDEIEEFKVPRRCVVVPTLPLTRNGKVDRKELVTAVAEHV
ncbi:Acyl-CoA synthetase (AMP-forming)/AMP-acid ligase II [Streptomyces sp. DvalAA-14]|uniref:class I adenylate-forming enzyme family protein n=1 Tax=unclassified Streptomyces TaxID=2593676 RepID=UPI00081B7279|nr:MULTISPECIES: class I adenylate-forming enzyme family protein [unclassified Streptomyces]MYS24049.1 AMP-binding protein [Streptomyces sp. SID4948]SCE42014.1 Acyl-CoA synthetase (AMP-forming)/AMP-acid ligase II [Streptomyces sp. DvalAA-14]